MKFLILGILLSICSAAIMAQHKEIPFTLDDRDRLIKVEEQLISLNQRFDDMNSRIDRLEDKFDTYFTRGFGLVLGAIIVLMGFILWDRRTTLAPVQQQQQKMLEALKEMGKTNSVIREALNKVAL